MDPRSFDLAGIARVVGSGTLAAARSKYRDVEGQSHRAGTSASGAPAATDWFFATGSIWYEGHAATGIPSPASRWAFAGTELAPDTQIYPLAANYGDAAGQMLVTLAYEDGTAPRRLVDMAPRTRATLEVGSLVAEASGRRFQLQVESLGPPLLSVR